MGIKQHEVSNLQMAQKREKSGQSGERGKERKREREVEWGQGRENNRKKIKSNLDKG